MRCYVAVWPAGEVLDALHAVDRPVVPGLRWTTPEQWHVTLRFLGEVADHDAAGLIDAVERSVGEVAVMTAVAGPSTRELGGQLVVPVNGVDELAGTVVAAIRSFGSEPERRRFRGHLTLGRIQRGRSVPRDLLRRAFAGQWAVESVAVVRSHLDPGGARYEELARIPLRPAGGQG